MLCNVVFLLYSTVNHIYVCVCVCVCIYIPSLFGFSSHLGYCRALDRVPWAIQLVLMSYLLCTVVYMSIPITQFIPPPPFPPWCPHVCSLHLCLCFCFKDRWGQIFTIWQNLTSTPLISHCEFWPTEIFTSWLFFYSFIQPITPENPLPDGPVSKAASPLPLCYCWFVIILTLYNPQRWYLLIRHTSVIGSSISYKPATFHCHLRSLDLRIESEMVLLALDLRILTVALGTEQTVH